ncbi:MAG TPA: glycosyltransferase [Stellaceae bacterium]|jgi:glycosyltransferase involved in cell wall biosynthesis|nr:glycosyltransferase [Stellaceae bacterium]
MEAIIPDTGAASAPARHPTVSVSVLLPNYNHAEHIGQALSALAAQTRPADEIIVVDDDSTDGSLAVIEPFLAQLPQLRLIRNSANLGVAGSINRALAEARSTYVVCSAADDWLRPGFIERMVKTVERFPGLPLYISQCVRFYTESGQLREFGPDSELGCWYVGTEPQLVSPLRFRQLLDRQFVWLPLTGALLDRDAFRQIGGLDPALRWHSDWFVAYSLALRSGFAVLPEPHAVFRVSSDSYSGNGMRDPLQQRAVCVAIYEKLLQPEHRETLRLLRRHPSAFSPLMRNLLLGLARRPRDWPFLVALLRWWSFEVLHGRRPGMLRDVVDRWRSTKARYDFGVGEDGGRSAGQATPER